MLHSTAQNLLADERGAGLKMSDKAVGQAGQQLEAAAKHVARHSWFAPLARFGYAAKGVVYLIVGALATLTALGLGGDTTDTRGALRAIAGQPYGTPVLAVVAIGLFGYALWRVVQSVADVDHKGRSAKGLAVRAAYLGSGLVYAGIALRAALIALGAGGQDTRSPQQSWSAWLLAWPYGNWVVWLGGLGVIGFGCYQLYKGYRAKFRRRLALDGLRPRAQGLAVLSGRLGYCARGIVFLLIGLFLMQAADNYNPTEAKGLDGALHHLAIQRQGSLLLGAVALGLAAYGCYALVEARYRRINDA